MDVITAPKSPSLNRLEGMMLTGLLQALPTYAGAALLLKVVGSTHIVGHAGGAVSFVLLASFFHALCIPWLAPKYPKYFKNSYEPLFFDPSLSLAEKVLQWRTQPMASLQLLSSVLMLSVLAVAALSVW